jgi:adhesin/invasin
MLLNKLFRTPKNQVSTPRPECGVGFDSSARAMNRDTKENVSLVSFERKQMLNTLKRKIALVAVSAVGMSGLALMSAPAANAKVTAITAVTNNPFRATNTAGAFITANVTATTDTTQVNNIVVGETVAIFGVITAAPTAANADSLTIAGVGETISGTGYLKNGVASDIKIFGSESNVAVDPLLAGAISRFNTAGAYAVTLWIDHTTFGGGGSNGVYNDGESLFNATLTVGGAPTAFALSKTSAEVAGDAAATLGITLKDTGGRPTLFGASAGESITAAATIASLSTETLTVRRGTTMTSNASAGGLLLSQHRGSATPPGFFNVSANDSITAATGMYNIALNHSGKTSSSLVLDWGGTLFLQRGTPQTFALTSLTSGTVTKVELGNTSGVQVDSKTVAASGVGTPEVFTAPKAVETPTTYVYAVNPSQTTITLKLTGTAGVIVNVTVSGSTVAGVTSGVTPITIGADGTATVSYAATTASGTFTVTIPMSTSDVTLGNSVSTFTYESSVVTGAALGSNGISTDVLSTSVTTVIKKIGDTTAIKVNVKDQYGVNKQFYTVAGTLSAASRNFGATITSQFTDADGNATLTLKDASTSATNLTDVLSIGVEAPSVTLVAGGLLTGTSDRALTINYSATGLYASLAIAGGTTAAATVTKQIESVTGSTFATVSLVPTLKDSLGAVVSGVALTYTGSDGVYFRAAQATRPTTGDVKTLTKGSATTVFAFGTKPGVATVTVTGGGLTATATFTVSAAVAATARNLSATAAAGRVTGVVTDGWGNPVAGVEIKFASDSKGIFGNGTSSTAAVTDATGSASALVQSSDGTGADTTVISTISGAQSAAIAEDNVTDFKAGVATISVVAKPTAGAASTDTAITGVKTDVTAVKADVATANAAVKALATQVTVLQASVATLIDSLTTQIASLMKSVSALTKAVAKLQTATKKK